MMHLSASGVSVLLFIFLRIAAEFAVSSSSSSRSSRILIPQEDDPNARYLCTVYLSDSMIDSQPARGKVKAKGLWANTLHVCATLKQERWRA